MTPSDSATEAPPVPPRAAGPRHPRSGQDVRELLLAFSRTASSALNLPAGLAVLCHSAAERFGAARVAAWLHDRRARELVLAASSDPAGAAEGARVRADSDLLPAIALRREQALRLDAAPGVAPSVIALPLRGRRRALGVLVFEGLSAETDPTLLPDLDDLGRQLSAAIENLQLLEDVLRSRREVAQTFDSLEDLVAVCDSRLRIVHVNRTLADRLGHARDRIFDRPLAEVVGAEARTWLASLKVGAGRSQSPATFARELDDEVLGGRFTLTITPVPGADASVGGLVFVARDITGQTRLEAERTALREQLAQAEKLSSLGRFVAGIAHELNNPLQAVIGHVDLLLRQKTTPAALRKDLAAVSQEAGRAARIVENLLVFAGGHRTAKRPVNLNTVVARALAQRSRERRVAHVEVQRKLADPLPPVAGHSLLLQQAIHNILLNAEQELAAHGGGRIDVTTTKATGRVRLEIRDNGPGIAPAVLPRVFEPFFTTKDVSKGTGLGLAIAYGVVTEHGGTVSAANHPRGGAAFVVELPATRPAPARRAARDRDGR
jgi:two-component system, NtrC family, sensor kinase